MKQVAKYNIFKGLSTLITAACPIIAAISCSDFIVTNTGASISVCGIIGILIAVLCMKDKFMEQVKTPTGFKVCLALLVIVLVVEAVLIPVKTVLIVSIIAFGVDELSFKRIYKNLELRLPEIAKTYKHLGFYFCKSEALVEEKNNG